MQGRLCVRFQQPAPIEPGPLGNIGWREEEAAARTPAPAATLRSTPAAPTPSAAAPSKPMLDPSRKYITRAMLEQHADERSIWFAVNGKVYDGTDYLRDHPGGADSILGVGGEDATDVFDAVHSTAAKEQLSQYYLADLAPDGFTVPAILLYRGGGVTAQPRTGAAAGAPATAAARARAAAAPDTASGAQGSFLEASRWKAVVLKQRSPVSPDVVVFRFALERAEQVLGLPTGKHVMLRNVAGAGAGAGDVVTRPYTPTTADETPGHFDVAVKIYRRGIHPDFPAGGKFSQVR